MEQTTTLAFRVAPATADRVHRLADLRGLTRSDLLREALDLILDTENGAPSSRTWPDERVVGKGACS